MCGLKFWSSLFTAHGHSSGEVQESSKKPAFVAAQIMALQLYREGEIELDGPRSVSSLRSECGPMFEKFSAVLLSACLRLTHYRHNIQTEFIAKKQKAPASREVGAWNFKSGSVLLFPLRFSTRRVRGWREKVGGGSDRGRQLNFVERVKSGLGFKTAHRELILRFER
jgi:hypothetical protein